MPVGRFVSDALPSCKLKHANEWLCVLHEAHGGECRTYYDKDTIEASFQPCDPFSTCSCDKCKSVIKISELCWKCEKCGRIDIYLTKLSADCPHCKLRDYDKAVFFERCVSKGLVESDDLFADAYCGSGVKVAPKLRAK